MKQLDYSKKVNNTIISEAVKRANNRIIAIGKEYGIGSEPYNLAIAAVNGNDDLEILKGIELQDLTRMGTGSRSGMTLFDVKKIKALSRSDKKDMLAYLESIETRSSLENKALTALNISKTASKEERQNAVREYSKKINDFTTAKAQFYNLTAQESENRQEYVPELYHKGRRWETYAEYDAAKDAMLAYINKQRE